MQNMKQDLVVSQLETSQLKRETRKEKLWETDGHRKGGRNVEDSLKI